jgi:hypothetical protein
MIIHVQPVSNVKTLTIEGYLFALKQVGDEKRDYFFRILIWPVVVGATCENAIQFVCSSVGSN